MSCLRLLLAYALLVVSLLCSPAASAETLTCTDITTLPYTISAAGNYCLNQNFSAVYASQPITINASNVVLDCNDHSITHTGSAAINGVYAANKSLVTVRNCALIGFSRGIAFFETGAGLSRNNRVSGNDVRKGRLVGIQVAGSANIVENNRISENFGGSNTYTYGILLSSYGATGVGNVIRSNLITNISPSLSVRVTGIYLLDIQNTAVKDNVISALFPPRDLGAYGIVGSPTTFGTAAVGNTILAVTGNPPGGGGGLIYDGASYDGIRFDAIPTSSNRNVCRSNTVGHFVSDITAESGSAGCVIDANTTF
jgi:parallel beta-helix repeat protein